MSSLYGMHNNGDQCLTGIWKPLVKTKDFWNFWVESQLPNLQSYQPYILSIDKVCFFTPFNVHNALYEWNLWHISLDLTYPGNLTKYNWVSFCQISGFWESKWLPDPWHTLETIKILKHHTILFLTMATTNHNMECITMEKNKK